MATHDDTDSIHTITPTPSLHHNNPLPPKSDVDTHFRLDSHSAPRSANNSDEGEAEDEDPQTTAASPPPPTFSSHNFHERYFPAPSPADPFRALVTEATSAFGTSQTAVVAEEEEEEDSGPAPPTFEESSSQPLAQAGSSVLADTKAALPRDTKDSLPPGSAASGASRDVLDDGEPPPPYTEGSSPLEGFTYVLTDGFIGVVPGSGFGSESAGGTGTIMAASVITQVQQGGGGVVAPISTTGLGGELRMLNVLEMLCVLLTCPCDVTGSDENITLELR